MTPAWQMGAYAFAALFAAFVFATAMAGWWAGFWWALGGILIALVAVTVLRILMAPFVWLAQLVEERRQDH